MIAGRLVGPIDVLFRSLARERRERAIGIILSGTGSDGSAGAAEIRRLGGFTVAQDAAAAYRDMPENAIAMGGIDRVLPVESCPQAILSHLTQQRGLPLDAASSRPVGDEAGALAAIVAEIQRVTGHDVSSYKDQVVRRRVAHRMMLRGRASLADYARSLPDNADEVHRLWQGFLIGVTEFFRDPPAFDALGRALDVLLASRPEGSTVNAWVAGCATGEEAFSVAIALQESMDRIGRSLDMRVVGKFAPPSALIDDAGDILELAGQTDIYLQPADAATGAGNICRRVRSGLQAGVALAIQAAAGTGTVACRRGLHFEGEAGLRRVDVRAERVHVPGQSSGFLLVSFLAAAAAAPPGTEQGAVAHEELQIVNQELLSMNDELRATNVELERSLEVLSERAAELEAANAELADRVAELSASAPR